MDNKTLLVVKSARIGIEPACKQRTASPFISHISGYSYT